jgi:hypothetical protein
LENYNLEPHQSLIFTLRQVILLHDVVSRIPNSITITMLLKGISTIGVAFVGIVSAACTADTRLAGAKQGTSSMSTFNCTILMSLVVYAYNLVDPGASAAAFKGVPFSDTCLITM